MLNSINGSYENAYNNLSKYCDDILGTNLCSTVVLEHTIDNRFHRMFVSFSASVSGFAYCCPVIGLDDAHLKTKFKGILLATATAIVSILVLDSHCQIDTR